MILQYKYEILGNKYIFKSIRKQVVVALVPQSKVENNCGSRRLCINPKDHVRLLSLLG